LPSSHAHPNPYAPQPSFIHAKATPSLAELATNPPALVELFIMVLFHEGIGDFIKFNESINSALVV
jgi:hypothetical protein